MKSNDTESKIAMQKGHHDVVAPEECVDAHSSKDRTFSMTDSSNDEKKWLLGGSIALTICLAVSVCCILPLIVFLIMFFTMMDKMDDEHESHPDPPF